MRQLAAFFSISTLAIFALLTWAHEAPVDTLGCHEEEETGSYHCHGGKLAGREFSSKNEAQDALQALEKTSVPSLKVMSWNMNKVGKELFEYDRIASVLSAADVVTLQEVEFSNTGETSVMVIANILQKRRGEKICKGWFKSSSTGDRGRHALLWRNEAVSLVDASGEIHDQCTDAPEIIRVDKKKLDPTDPYFATFFHKGKKQMFTVASVYLATPKAGDVLNVFKKAGQMGWPVVITGDFNLRVKDKVFDEARKNGFMPALVGKRGRGPAAYDNFWVKNLVVVQGEPINLYEWFADLKPKDVDGKIAKRFPILGDFTFSKGEGDVLKMEVVKKKAAKKAKEKEIQAKAKKEKASIKPPLKPSDLNEDLESEASDIDKN